CSQARREATPELARTLWRRSATMGRRRERGSEGFTTGRTGSPGHSLTAISADSSPTDLTRSGILSEGGLIARGTRAPAGLQLAVDDVLQPLRVDVRAGDDHADPLEAGPDELFQDRRRADGRGALDRHPVAPQHLADRLLEMRLLHDDHVVDVLQAGLVGPLGHAALEPLGDRRLRRDRRLRLLLLAGEPHAGRG